MTKANKYEPLFWRLNKNIRCVTKHRLHPPEAAFVDQLCHSVCVCVCLSVFELGYSHTVLCAIVYRPPKYNNDFADMLSIENCT